jgi:hypothetical protein
MNKPLDPQDEDRRLARFVAFLMEEEVERKLGDAYFERVPERFRQRLQASLVRQPSLRDRIAHWWVIGMGFFRSRWSLGWATALAVTLASILGLARWKESPAKASLLAAFTKAASPSSSEQAASQARVSVRQDPSSAVAPPVTPSVISPSAAEYVLTGAPESYDPRIAF